MARSKVRTAGIVVLAIVGVVGVLAAGTNSLWVPILKASRNLDAEMAKAKAAGFPMVAADLAPHVKVLESENAASLLMAAGQSKVELTGTFANGQVPSPNELNAFLTTLSLAEQIASRPKFDMHLDFDEGLYLMLPHLSQLRTCAKALATMANIEAEEGRMEDAVRHCRMILQVGNHLDEDETLTGLLVQQAIHGIYNRCVTDLAATWQHNPACLAELTKLCQEPIPDADLRRALHGEYYMGLHYLRNELPIKVFNMPNSGPDDTFEDIPKLDSAKVKRRGLPRNPIHRANLEVLTKSMLELDAFIAAGHTEREIAQWGEDWDAKTKLHLSNKIAKDFVPAVPGAAMALLRHKAMTVNRTAVVAIWTYYAKNNKFPKSLGATGFVGEDPYSGLDLCYSNTGDGFKVYCVGENMTDDGGYSPSSHVDDVCVFWPLPVPQPSP